MKHFLTLLALLCTLTVSAQKYAATWQVGTAADLATLPTGAHTSESQVAYVNDENAFYLWNGTAWVLNSPSVMTGTDDATAGDEGLVPVAPVGAGNKQLLGSGVFGEALAPWVAGKIYTAGNTVHNDGKIYYKPVSPAHTSAVDFATDEPNWNILGGASPLDSIWMLGDTTFFRSVDGTQLDTLVASKAFPVDTTGFAALTSPTVGINATGDTIVVKEATAAQSINVDASAAAYTSTLAASNLTDGVDVAFYTNIDVTNTATLAVQAGETLNGVADGTFLFSNYTAGTQFRADEVTGGWVVSVVGASTKKQRHYVYLNTRTTSTITDTPDGKIPFNDPNWTTDDPYTMIDATNVTRINILQDGRYHVRFEANVNGAGTDVDRLQMLKNGTEVLHNGILYELSSNSDRAYVYVDYRGELLANDYIEIRDPDGAAIASDISNATMTVEQVETEETVLAGMLTPENLHTVSISTPTGANLITGNTVALAEGNRRVVDLQDADLEFNDPYGMVDITLDQINILQDGRYKVSYSVSVDIGNSSSTPTFFQNGTRVSGQFAANSASEHNATMFAIIDANVGDFLHFGINSSSGIGFSGLSVLVEQIPQSTVVMPDAVPVEDISVVGLFDNQVAAIFDGYEFRANSGVLEFEMRVTSGTKAISGFTSYDLGGGQNAETRDLQLDQVWRPVWIDSSLDMPGKGDFQRLYWTDGTNEYEFRGIVGAGYNNNFIEIKRLNQKSVINQNNAEVVQDPSFDDTATDKVLSLAAMAKQYLGDGTDAYYDLPGTNIRVVWGLATGQSAETFPGGGFANTNFRLVMTISQSVGTNQHATISTPTKSATGFTPRVTLSTNGATPTTFNGQINYIAIGPKP